MEYIIIFVGAMCGNLLGAWIWRNCNGTDTENKDN